MAGAGCLGVKLQEFRIQFEEIKLGAGDFSAENYIGGGRSGVKLEEFRIPFGEIKLGTGDFSTANCIGGGGLLEEFRIQFEEIKLGTGDFRAGNYTGGGGSGELEHFRIPFEEIELGAGDLSAGNYVGGGGFGKVYKGKLSDFWIYNAAVKRLDPNCPKILKGKLEFLNEISVLFSYKHENIINFIGYCGLSEEMIIVYEYAVNRSLDKYMSTISRETCQKICFGAAKGLKYLRLGLDEQHRVVHRDIKSTNILLDENWEAKNCDFGFAKMGHKDLQYNRLHTKVAAISPEQNKEYDVYSLGVVLFEIV